MYEPKLWFIQNTWAQILCAILDFLPTAVPWGSDYAKVFYHSTRNSEFYCISSKTNIYSNTSTSRPPLRPSSLARRKGPTRAARHASVCASWHSVRHQGQNLNGCLRRWRSRVPPARLRLLVLAMDLHKAGMQWLWTWSWLPGKASSPTITTTATAQSSMGRRN